MSTLVVDASVAAKWFFDEDRAAEALRVLDARHRLHAPDFLLIEFDNLIWKRVRRGEITAAEGRRTRRTLRRLPVEAHPSGPLLDLAYAVAVRTGRTVYDSLYVALAIVLKGRVVSADRRLCTALAGGPFSQYVLWVGDLAP